MGTALPAEDGTYKMPVSAGVTVERKLNDYLGIETGLLYSNLRSAGQHLHYLGIPLKANVTLMDTKKVDLYATVGGVADNFKTDSKLATVRTKRPTNFNLLCGLRMTY